MREFRDSGAVEDRPAGAAELAPVAIPGVLRPLKPDVPSVGSEGLSDGMLAVSALRAIDTSPRQQARELGDADAEHLLCQDVGPRAVEGPESPALALD